MTDIRRVYEIDVKLAASAAEALRQIQQNMRDLEKAADGANDKFKGGFLGGKLGFNIASFGLIKQGVDAIAGSVVAMIDKWKGIAEVQASLERLRLGFSVVDPRGLAGAGEQIDYVRAQANKLGVDFQTAADAFLKVSAAAKGTTLEGARTREVFETISLVSRNLGLTNAQTERAFLALNQMMSKGVVQAEELRGQLGEAIPGTMQAAARAMGVTTAAFNKLVEAGKVIPDEFIPKLMAAYRESFGKEIPESVNEANKALRNFDSNWLLLKQSVTDAGLGKIAADNLNIISGAFADAAKAMREAKEEGQGFFTALSRGFVTAVGFGGKTISFDEQLNQLDVQLQLAQKRAKANRETLLDNPFAKASDDEQIKQIELQIRALLRADEVYKRLQAERKANQQYDEKEITLLTGRTAANKKLDDSLTNLQGKYKDKQKTQQLELAQLDAVRDRLSGLPGEYDRLRAAIIKAGKEDGDNSAETAAKRAQRFLDRLNTERQSLILQQQIGAESKKNASQQAEAEEIAAKLDKRAAAAFRLKADAAIDLAEVERQRVERNKEVARMQEQFIDLDSRRIQKILEETAADKLKLEIYGNDRERTLQLASAKLELAEAEALLNAQELRRRPNADSAQTQSAIAYYENLVRILREARVAKEDLYEKEYNDKQQRLIEEADRQESKSIQKSQDEIRDALYKNFRESKDVAKAFFDTFQDTLEKKAVKIVVDAVTDPFVKAMQEAINEITGYLATALRKALSSIDWSNMGSSAGNWLTNLFGPNTGSGNIATDNAYASGYGWMDFAKGGVMTQWGPADLRTYAGGGIANSPQIAIYGEGSQNEAYVPLPDGRTIPVTMTGNEQSGQVTVNVFNQGGDMRVSRTETRRTNQTTEIDVFVEQIEAKMGANIRKGSGLAPTMENQYGLNRAVSAF